MPLSIAERLHQLPHGAQAAVAEKFELSATTISAIMRGVYPRPETEPALTQYRAVQTALAAKLGSPVWEVFAEWDGERPLAAADPTLDRKSA
jgi:hypothetical protein